MPAIEIKSTGVINKDDSAYPSLLQADDNTILAAFSVGGGPKATGGTDWAYSCDEGRSWTPGGTILAPGTSPRTRNMLRLSRADSNTLLAYGMWSELYTDKMRFGSQIPREPVFCRSEDNGRTWGDAEFITTPIDGPWEICNPIVVLSDGRWLAPAATLCQPDRLGEQVVVFISEDQGLSWPNYQVVLKDPEGIKGFLEQRLIELKPGHLLACAWTVRMKDYSDLDDHFATSRDGGLTWSPPFSTGIRGQTLTPICIGDNRLLVLYNRRYGDQGIQAALVQLADDHWTVECEQTVWDARKSRDANHTGSSGIDEFDDFEFGFPSALPLGGGKYLAVHWNKEDGNFVVRWTRLHIRS